MSYREMKDKIYEMVYSNHFVVDKPVWCIGDVHGCSQQYKDLLDLILRQTPDCLIFQLGDLIDRGPDLYEVFKITQDYNVVSIIGNHDLNFIQELNGYKHCRSKERAKNHQLIEMIPFSQKHFIIESIQKMHNYATVEVDGKIWMLSHAPIMTPINEQYDCGNASNYCMGNTPYDDNYTHCVHGHQHWNYTPISEQLLSNKNECYNIDSGCCYPGGRLTALELSSKQILSVKGPLN